MNKSHRMVVNVLVMFHLPTKLHCKPLRSIYFFSFT